MKEPRWLTRLMIDVMHSELILEHGGLVGVRKEGESLIESALCRPRNRYAYQAETPIEELAACYLYGLAKNHGYIDGNKRIAFAAAVVFLMFNGLQLTASEVEAYEVVIGMVEGRYLEKDVTEWLKKHVTSLKETL